MSYVPSINQLKAFGNASPNSAQAISNNLVSPKADISNSALSFEEFARQSGYTGSTYGLSSTIRNFFGGELDELKDSYGTYLQNYNNALEKQNKLDEFSIQKESMLKAGLNPYAIYGISQGAVHNSSAPSTQKYGYNDSSTDKTTEANNMAKFGKTIIATAATILMLMAMA